MDWLGWITLDFMRQAFIGSFMAAIACGILGTLIVVNRMVFIAGGLAHAAYGGVGLALYFRLPLLPTVLSFSSCCAVLLGHITYERRHHTDATVGALWSIGMALGVIFVHLTPGYQADFMGYLFGSILTIVPSDIITMALLDLILLLWIGVFYREVMVVSYDRDYAKVMGIPDRLVHYVILVFSALTIMLLMRFVGLILALAMLSIPSYLAERWSNSLKMMMAIAGGLSFLFMTGGLVLSYHVNLPPGPVMILVAGVTFTGIEISSALSRRFSIKKKTIDTV